MRKILNKVIVVLITASFLLGYTQLFSNVVYAAEKAKYVRLSDDKLIYEKNKPITITLSKEIDKSSLKQKNVYIMDNNNKVYDVSVKISTDNKKIIVTPPAEGYKKNVRYTVYVKDIKSKNGKKIRENVKQSFTYTPEISPKDPNTKNDSSGEQKKVEPKASYELKKNVVSVNDADKFNDFAIKVLEEAKGNDDSTVIEVAKEIFEKKPSVGETVWIKPTDKYLQGLVFKVNSIEDRKGSYYIHAGKASIEDLFSNLKISENYKTDDIKSNKSRRSKRDTEGHDVSIASMNVGVSGNVDVDIRQKKFDLSVNVYSDLGARVSIGEKVTKEYKKDLFNNSFYVATPIPGLIINSNIDGKFKFTFESNSEVSGDVHIKLSRTVGVRFNKDKNKFEDYSKDNDSNIGINVNSSGSLNINPKISVEPKVGITIGAPIKYLNVNIGNIFFQLEIGPKMSININGNISLSYSLSDEKFKYDSKVKISGSLDLRFHFKAGLNSDTLDFIKVMVGYKNVDISLTIADVDKSLYKYSFDTDSQNGSTSSDKTDRENELSYEEASEKYKNIDVTNPSDDNIYAINNFFRDDGRVRGLRKSNKAKILFIPKTIDGIEVEAISIPTIGDVEYYNINEVFIPNTVTYISGLGHHYIEHLNLAYGVENIPSGAFKGNILKKLILPDSVEKIDSEAFMKNELTYIKLSDNLSRIGEAAFLKNKLESVSIPNSVSGIYEKTFMDNRISSVDIPESVKHIGKLAFANNLLEYVRIPSGINTIKAYSFNNNKIKQINLPDNLEVIEENSFGHNLLEKVLIPEKVNFIGEEAFSKNRISSVNIPNSVKHIGKGAFVSNRLYSIKIPSSITYIEEYSFSDNRLSSLNIPSSVTHIGSNAFRHNNLTSLNIPSSVTYIGSGAFAENNLSSLNIPSSITSISYGAFRYNDLTSLNIPSSVTSIGSNAFDSNNLSSVKFTENLTSIGESAFMNNNLYSINIPSGVDKIGNLAFSKNSLSSVFIPESVTSIGADAFKDNPLRYVEMPEKLKGSLNLPKDCTVKYY